MVIEPDCDPGVNEARRLTVVAFLEQHGIANAAQIVHLGYPQAEGLYADEAERVYRQMLTPANLNNLNNQNSFQNSFQNNNVGTVQSGFGGVVGDVNVPSHSPGCGERNVTTNGHVGNVPHSLL